ncbi:tripartite motif-containing protein 16-like protein [Danio rerio]|uniref:Tripartite motif-containing protein 16-like protein n=1 Tax=Danio rerio TaxID=7955 RepID=A0A8N7T6X9_DANRE
MAEFNSRWIRDRFSCSVCLDLLKEPVTIPCGHSYCMNCITDCWNQDEQRRVYSCPQCRQTFTPRPALNKNVMLAEMVEKAKVTRRAQTTDPAVSYAGSGDVECDVCNGRKRKAVKSCLLCLESYCESHFECHEESRSKKRHKVTDATGRIQEMICPKHDRLLEVYCRTDQKCVCLMCVMDEHKNHDTVSAEAERAEKQKQVGEIKRKWYKKIQERQKENLKLREDIKNHKSSAQTAVEDSERIFTELIQYIERRRSEVTQTIRDREKTEVSRAEGLLKKLQQEIEDLKRRNTELEQLSHTDDHIHFLQSFQSLSESLKSAAVRSPTVSSAHPYEDVRKSVSNMKQKLEQLCKQATEQISGHVTYINIISNNEPKTREEFLQYSCKLTLDPNTAHKQLHLSDENRVASFTTTMHPYPDHPDRFDTWPQVLCRESVCGRCYWEVEWTDGVSISVSYKSISRKGETKRCSFGHTNESWRLQCSQSSHLFLHNDIKTKLGVSMSSSRIGVYVDHRAGILSFFSVSHTTMSLINRVQTTFTQPLYPGFAVYGSKVKLIHFSSA